MSGGMLGLIWRSFGQSFRRESQVRRASLFALVASILVGVGLIAVATVTRDGTPTAQVLLGGAAIVAVLLAALIGDLGHAADPLDERALALAGQRPSQAAVGAFGAALLSPRALVWWLTGLAMAVVLRPDAVGLLGGLAIALTLMSVDRIGTSIGRALAERRIGREVRAVLGYAVLLLIPPTAFTLAFLPWQTVLADLDAPVAAALHSIPPAAGVLAEFAGSPWRSVAIGLAGALLAAVIAMVNGARTGRRAMRYFSPGGVSRLGIQRTALGSPVRMIAWRIAAAWLRDGRYAVILVTVFLLPLILLVPLAIGGVPREWLVLLPMPLFGFMLGWSLHNDLAYDSTAVWLHVTSGMRGASDRLGRALPTLILGTIVIVLGGLMTAVFAADWKYALAAGSVALALLWVSAGGSSLMSVLAPYPVAQPDESPFTQPVRSWGGAVVAHPVAGLIEIALCIPVIWLAVTALREGSTNLLWGAFAAAVALGVAVFAIGVAIGGRVFERRGTRIMQFAQMN